MTKTKTSRGLGFAIFGFVLVLTTLPSAHSDGPTREGRPTGGSRCDVSAIDTSDVQSLARSLLQVLLKRNQGSSASSRSPLRADLFGNIEGQLRRLIAQDVKRNAIERALRPGGVMSYQNLTAIYNALENEMQVTDVLNRENMKNYDRILIRFKNKSERLIKKLARSRACTVERRNSQVAANEGLATRGLRRSEQLNANDLGFLCYHMPLDQEQRQILESIENNVMDKLVQMQLIERHSGESAYALIISVLLDVGDELIEAPNWHMALRKLQELESYVDIAGSNSPQNGRVSKYDVLRVIRDGRSRIRAGLDKCQSSSTSTHDSSGLDPSNVPAAVPDAGPANN